MRQAKQSTQLGARGTAARTLQYLTDYIKPSGSSKGSDTSSSARQAKQSTQLGARGTAAGVLQYLRSAARMLALQEPFAACWSLGRTSGRPSPALAAGRRRTATRWRPSARSTRGRCSSSRRRGTGRGGPMPTGMQLGPCSSIVVVLLSGPVRHGTPEPHAKTQRCTADTAVQGASRNLQGPPGASRGLSRGPQGLSGVCRV